MPSESPSVGVRFPCSAMCFKYGDVTRQGFLNEETVLGQSPTERSYEEQRLEAQHDEEQEASSSAILIRQPSSASITTIANVHATSENVPNMCDSRFRNHGCMIDICLADNNNNNSYCLVHENLLIQVSGLTKTTLNHERQEKEEQSISILDAVADDVDAFVEYLYSRHIDPSPLCFHQLLSLYVMANYLAAPAFQELVMDEIGRRTDIPLFGWTAERIQYVMEHTTKQDPGKPCLRNHIKHQFSLGVLANQYVSQSAEEQRMLEPHMAELFQGVVEQVDIRHSFREDSDDND